MDKDKALSLAKKLKEWTEILMLDYDKKKHDKERYIDLYDWSCTLLKELES